jgi:hypothetical protein
VFSDLEKYVDISELDISPTRNDKQSYYNGSTFFIENPRENKTTLDYPIPKFT